MSNKVQGSQGLGVVDCPKVHCKQLRIIGYHTPHKRGEHPLFDSQVLDLDRRKLRWLINSIKRLGVKDPMKVQRDGLDAEGHAILNVVDGRKRAFCLEIANEELRAEGGKEWPAPVLIQTGNDLAMAELSALSNEQRFQRTTLERAEVAHALRDRGSSEERLMELFMVSKATLGWWERLLEMDERVLNAIRDGKVKANRVKHLINLSRDEQWASVEQILAGKGAAAPHADHDEEGAAQDGDGEAARGTEGAAAGGGGAPTGKSKLPTLPAPYKPAARNDARVAIQMHHAGGSLEGVTVEGLLMWFIGAAECPAAVQKLLDEARAAKPGSPTKLIAKGTPAPVPPTQLSIPGADAAAVS